MMRRLWANLTYANVMSTLAVFLVVSGGAAYAASHLGKNSVGTKQLKKNAVVTSKIKKGAVTGTKLANGAITGTQVKSGSLTGTQVNASTLGTVPTAQNASTAQTANTLTAPEAWHEVGAPGQPEFLNSWANLLDHAEPIGFYKDQEGVVHLKGTATAGVSSAIFRLPPGYRPENGDFIRVPVACFGAGCPNDVGALMIVSSNFTPLPEDEDAVLSPTGATDVSLSGVTFRAGS